MNFSSFHLAFYNAYKALGGLELKDITEDDALLLYLSLYPYNESMEKLTGEIKKDLEKIWKNSLCRMILHCFVYQ